MRKTWTSDVCGLLTGMWATIVLAGFVLGVLTKSIVLPSTPVLQPDLRAMASATGVVACYVTVPSREVARGIAESLISSKLAACVNVIPGVESMYWWQGKMEVDNELLLMIKTREALVGELTEKVRAAHPYDVCEVICVPVTGGNQPYLEWVLESTKEV